jgi:hypothetical protein
MPRAQQRCLVRMEDEVVVAYACEGHTFRRAHDDTLWAHESEGILYSARSGVALAHRVGNIFYDPVTNVALYYEMS